MNRVIVGGRSKWPHVVVDKNRHKILKALVFYWGGDVMISSIVEDALDRHFSHLCRGNKNLKNIIEGIQNENNQ